MARVVDECDGVVLRGEFRRSDAGGCGGSATGGDEKEPARTEVAELAVPRRHVLSKDGTMGISHLGLWEAGVLGRI